MKQKRIKISHIMTRYLGGGSETYVNHLIDKADHDKYEHIILYGKIHNKDLINKLKVETKCFKNLYRYNPITNLLAIKDIHKYLIDNDIDIIHTHQTEAGIIGRIAANLYKRDRLNKDIKIIHTVHGIPFTKNRNAILRHGIIYLERLVAPYTDHIITISKDMKKAYLENNIGKAEQYKYIPLGIDLDRFESLEDIDINIDTNQKTTKFVMVSRLTKGKGLKDLIEAIDYLSKLWSKIKFKVYIVGEWDNVKYKKDILDLIEKKDHIKFLGYRSDIPNILKACDVFILPSYYEGTPWTIYEAMAAGLPIISTNISGIPEQVEHDYNGYLIKPGDVGSLIEYMLIYCSLEYLVKKMGLNSKIKIKDFTIDKMIKNVERLYGGN